MVLQTISGSIGGNTSPRLTRAAITRKLAHQTRIPDKFKKALKNYAEKEGINIKSKYELSNKEAKKIITEVFYGKSKRSREDIMKEMKLKYDERPELETIVAGGKCTQKQAIEFIKKNKFDIFEDNDFYVENIRQKLEKGESMSKIKDFVRLQERRKEALVKSGRTTQGMDIRSKDVVVDKVTTIGEGASREKITSKRLGVEEQGQKSGFALGGGIIHGKTTVDKGAASAAASAAGNTGGGSASVVGDQAKKATSIASGLGVKAGGDEQRKSNVINVDFVNKTRISSDDGEKNIDDMFAENDSDDISEENNSIDNPEQYKKAA